MKLKLLSFIFPIFLSHATIYWPAQEINSSLFAMPGKNPVLIFDADQVLVDRHYSVPLMLFCYMFDITDQAAFLAELPTIINFDDNNNYLPTEIMHLFDEFDREFNKTTCDFDLDPAVDKLVAKYPILQQLTKSTVSLADYMKHQCSQGIPRSNTIKLLLKAHKAGYPIAIGTNQGYTTYERLIEAKTVPSQDHYLVIYTCDHPNNKLQNSSADQFPYAKKPSGKYFKGLRRALNEKNMVDRLFIFIDDNLENVKAAIKKGFIAIHFQTAEQTEQDLQSLGINL